VSNERIPLSDAMRMVFEIHTLKNATPATVSRAGALCTICTICTICTMYCLFILISYAICHMPYAICYMPYYLIVCYPFYPNLLYLYLYYMCMSFIHLCVCRHPVHQRHRLSYCLFILISYSIIVFYTPQASCTSTTQTPLQHVSQ
jgi:hypothetical protein